MTKETVIVGAIAFYIWMGVPGFGPMLFLLWALTHRA